MYRRSLLPREHGAYFQLGIPLVTACCVHTPTLAASLLSLGAVLAFLANEPLLIVLGHRGQRRKSIDGRRACVRLGLLATGALGLGGIGLALAPAALSAAAIVGIPAILLLVFAWRRAVHTLAGETVAAIALTGAALPVAIASCASFELAVDLWIGWAIGFAASVIAVHRVIARHRRSASSIDVAVAAVMVAVLVATTSGWIALLVAVPLVLLSTLLVVAAPPAERLRVIGVTIVGAAIASSAIVLGTS